MTAITAGAETAFFSLSAKDINYLKSNERPAARQVVQLLDQPKALLATILVANNFINIAIVISTNVLVEQFINPSVSPLLSFLVQVIVVTFLLVLFGEVLPKVYATQNNMRMALFSAPSLKVLLNIFRPVSNMLVSSTNFIEGRLGSKQANNISSEDFEHAIELTVGHTATKEEVNIFKGILKFGNITVRYDPTIFTGLRVVAHTEFTAIFFIGGKFIVTGLKSFEGISDKIINLCKILMNFKR